MQVNLVLFKKNGSMRSFPLPSTVTTIGRRQECDLCLPLMVVSKKHCQLNMDNDELTIRDLGSRNGTFLNDERIEEAIAEPGDRLRIGPVVFGIQIDGNPAGFSETSQEEGDDFVEDQDVNDSDDLFFAQLDENKIPDNPNASQTIDDFGNELDGNNGKNV